MIKNTDDKLRISTETYQISTKKFFLMFGLGIFMFFFILGSVSAFNFDNKLSYSNNDLKVDFKNAFGLGENIGSIELKSHKSVNEVLSVPIGEDILVMSYEVQNLDKLGLGEIYFKDMNTGKEIKKDYTIKYLSSENVDVDDFKEVCSWNELNNSNSCENVKSGSHKEKRDVWIELDLNNLPKGKVTIGLFTDVDLGDYIDGVWTFAGRKVSKHAVWIGSLNTQLISYWKLDETSGTTAYDSLGLHNGTLTGAEFTSSGKINYGVVSDATGDRIDIGNVTLQSSGTIGMWIYPTDLGSSTFLISKDYSGANAGDFNIQLDTDGTIFFQDNTGLTILTTNSSVNINSWSYVNFVWGGGTIQFYINGTGAGSTSNSPNLFGTEGGDGHTQFLAYSGSDTGAMQGRIDELGIWNRSLNSSEINYIWNAGSGMSYYLDNYPEITLNSPINYYNQSNLSVITFNCSATDDIQISNVSLYLNGVLNETNSSGLNNTDYIFSKTFSDGEYNWTCGVCDNKTQCTNASERYFEIDSTAPNVTILYPSDGETYTTDYTNSSTIDIDLNWTTSDTNLDTCWYYNGTANTTITCGNNATITLPYGEHTFIVYANDTFGNEAEESVTATWSYNLLENSLTYNSTIYETETANFRVNFTSTTTVQSTTGKLNYNGTEYTATSSCDGNTCVLTKDLSIPLISSGTLQSKNFYWGITIYDGSSSYSYNSSTYSQNVSRMYLVECNATFPTEALNFTAYDEGNLSRLIPFSFDGTFNYWIGGSGSIYRNLSISDSETNETRLCISPNKTFYIDGTIEYDSDVADYTKRTYLFDEYTIDNSSEDIELLLLVASDSTSFIQEVLENQEGVEDAYIYTYRYYSGTDEWKIVQITKTDSDGKTVAFYETETTQYKHTIIVNGVTRLEETTGRVIIPEDTPYTITFNLGEGAGIPYEDYDEDEELTKSLSYNDDTYIVTYSYTDTNSNAQGGRLIVYKENYAIEDTLICNTSSALSTATLTCNVSNYSGNFIAYAFIDRGTEELVDSIRFSKDDAVSTFGKTGMIAGWFLILTFTMAFLFHPIVGIIAINLAVILVNTIGLIKFGGTFIFGILAVSIIIIWLMKD